MKVSIDALETKFKVADSQFQLVSDNKQAAFEFLMPNRAHVFQDITAYGKKNKLNFDDWAPKCLSIFVNGITSMMASPNIAFLGLNVWRPNGKTSNAERAWLKEVEKALYHFYGTSGFYHQNMVATRDGAIGGTGILVQEMGDITEPLIFSAKHPAQVRIIVDQYGSPMTVFRTFAVMGEEALEIFKDEIGSDLKKSLEDSRDKLVKIRHCVTRTESLNAFGKKAADYYYFPDFKEAGIVREGSYRMLPVHVWMVDAAPNEPWGTGLGEQALGSVKSLNKIAEADLKVTQLAADPPKNVPKELNGEEDLGPDGRNYYEEPDRVITPIQMSTDPRFITEFYERRKKSVESWFYVDFFQMLTSIQRTMTAFEVSQRLNEKAGNIGPLITSYTHPYLKSVVERSVDILIELKLVPPVPASLGGAELMVDFESPLIKLQRNMFSEQDLNKLVELTGRMATFDPNAPRRINWQEVLSDQLRASNMDPKYEVPQEVIDKQMANEQQMAQASQMAEVLQKGGSGMKDMGLVQ